MPRDHRRMDRAKCHRCKQEPGYHTINRTEWAHAGDTRNDTIEPHGFVMPTN